MKTKTERITALESSEHSPIRTKAALEALSEVELTNLEAHVTKKTEEIAAKATAEVAARAAAAVPAVVPAVPTEEEWMKTAPPSIRTLVADAKERETAAKTKLVTVLKAAQKEYTEAELNAMSAKELSRLARLANVEDDSTVDFSGLGLPRAAASTEGDVYTNPPDGYRIALDAKAGKSAAQKGTVQ